MSITGAVYPVQSDQLRSSQTLIIQNDLAWNKTPELGQVLKGKVLRHFEGSRYSVEFAGQEKVVDSSIPLKPGESIHGKVTGIDDKVYLKRVYQNQVQENPGNQDKSVGNRAGYQGSNEKLLSELFSRYQAKLSSESRIETISQMKASRSPSLMAMSSLILSKLEIKQSPEFLKAVYQNLETRKINDQIRQDIPVSRAIRLDIDTTSSAVLTADVIGELGKKLDALFQSSENEKWVQENSLTDSIEEETENTAYEDSQSADDEPSSFWMLGRWLMNGQSDGSVSHRVSTFPLWLGGQLVEVSVALFNQKQSASNVETLDFKRIVLSLNTEQLGQVDIDVVTAKRSVRLDIYAETLAATEHMSGYLPELKTMINEAGWSLDGIRYGLNDKKNEDRVMHAVVEHHISQDSLNQLF